MGCNFFISVYNNLNTLYSIHSEALTPTEQTAIQKKCLSDLPETIKNRICSHIYTPNEASSAYPQYGEVDVFDSPSLLQEAVKLVTYEIFDSISHPERNAIAGKVWEYAKCPETDDLQWGEHHAKDNVPLLLKSLNCCLGDLTPELETILNTWIAQEGENVMGQIHHSLNVIETIKAFLKGQVLFPDMQENWGCQADHERIEIYANVSSLPPIFNQKAVVSRLHHLTLKYNRLAEIPKEICGLSELISLRFSNENSISSTQIFTNNTASEIQNSQNKLKIPSEIGKLSNLISLDLSGSEPESLPPEIGNLLHLKSLNLRDTRNLSELPKEIFNLPSDCKIEIEDSDFAIDPVFISNLQQTTTHNPAYNGPQFIFTPPIPLASASFPHPSTETIFSLALDEQPFPSLLNSTEHIDAILSHIFLNASNEEEQSFIDKNPFYLQSSIQEAKSQLLNGSATSSPLFQSNLYNSTLNGPNPHALVFENDSSSSSSEEDSMSGTTEDEQPLAGIETEELSSITEYEQLPASENEPFSFSNETTDSGEESSFLATEDEEW